MSLAMAGASALVFLSMTAMLSRPIVLVACIGALIGLTLGIAGLIVTRGREFGSRMPALIGIVLGSIVFPWAGLVFVLTMPF